MPARLPNGDIGHGKTVQMEYFQWRRGFRKRADPSDAALARQ